ncbi:hypothetical protein ACFL3Z_00100 [Gemmatimonadota bacterium]
MAHPGTEGLFSWRDVKVCVQATQEVLDACAGYLAMPCTQVEDETPFIRATSDDYGFSLETAGSKTSFPDFNTFILNLTSALSSRILCTSLENTLHSGAFVVDDRALLFTGSAESGKTTMAYTALTEGHTVVGDDWLRVSGGRVSAFPKPIMLRGSDAVPAEIETVAGELDGEVRRLIGRSNPGMASYDNDYRAGLIAILKPGFGARTRLTRASRTKSLSSFTEQILTPKGIVLESLGLLEKLWREDRVFELEVGRHQTKAAISMLMDRL